MATRPCANISTRLTNIFRSFEDSSEILADIESRIAEIFLSKLNEGKQVITAEDVNALITTMGSVSDFKAAEEQPGNSSSYQETAGGSYSTPPPSGGAASTTYVPPKRSSVINAERYWAAYVPG